MAYASLVAETEPIDVEPEPPDEVRQAIADALRRPQTGDLDPGPWWKAGVADAVRGDLLRD